MPELGWKDTVAPAEASLQACPDCGDIYTGGHHSCPEASGTTTPVLGNGGMAELAPPGHLGTREDIQYELDAIAIAIRQFHIKQPDMVMRECAAYSARLTEMMVLLHRVESTDRQYTRVRTQQVDRFLTEIDRQFKVASRLLEAQRQDLALMGGMT